MTDKNRRKGALRGPQVWGNANASNAIDWDANLNSVDIDLYGTNALVNINRDLASGYTNAAVVYIKQDNTGDDQSTLSLLNDATHYLTLDAQGWCNVGYTTSRDTSSTVPTGSVRLINNNSKWFWQVHTGSGTYKYLAISSSTTA